MNRRLLGILLLVVGLFPVLTFLFALKPHYVVWFSNHTFIVLGVAVLLNLRWLVFAQLCIGLLPESFWSLDFLWRVFFGEHLWGFTSYMFVDGGFNWLHLYSLQHLLFVPAAFFAFKKLKGSLDFALPAAFIHIAIVWVLSFLVGFELNLNCVFYSCALFGFLPFYQLSWMLLQVVNVLLVWWLVLYKCCSRSRIKG